MPKSYLDLPGNVWGVGGPDDQERLEITTRFIRKQIRRPSVIVECGPLHGAITVRLLAAFPEAELHLVEHQPSNTAVLRERFCDEPRVKVHEADMLTLPTLPVPPADTVLLVECLYYLDLAGRRAFVEGLRQTHPAAKVIVATPVAGGYYFTEPELRSLFSTYRLVGVDVTALGPISGVMARTLYWAKRLDLEAPVWRVVRSRVASHKIYAFNPRARRKFAGRGSLV
jgi:hypothetical protein